MKQERRDSDPKGLYIILTIWALTTIYPIIWVIMNSFKAKDKILSNSFALPTGNLFTLANYRKAFSNLNIFSAYRNSLVISGTVAAVVVIIAGIHCGVESGNDVNKPASHGNRMISESLIESA